MTNSDNDAGRSESSDSAAGGSEPSSAGYEAPPIEESQSSQPPDYTPPPAYNPPPPGYDQPPTYTPTAGYPPSGGFPPPDYPPPPAGYPPPYPDAGSPPPYPNPGYGAPGYGGAPYPPPYGTMPGGYPPAGGWTGADYGYGAPAPQGTNSMAIGSLVASCVGLFCCVGSILGIVLGIVAMNQIKQTHQDGHGLAIAGIVVGVVTLLISGITTLAIMGS
ncbi:DUF4190 domain-containing protein [Mycobacterium sp. NAZ190054]|uniref:DUF4190 domain-containing protein n=1 Tax=Mycobacterium sp. NAZ190054 TaxID=1747766 RepID=UPI00079633B5|nr:DUF4190 domain-containing protein [Mycobacterium sp. NAZ190054]KWX61767.1 hypothetical protein ASJ79_08770 [Mycobacterium sp. NAZ190054]